MMAARMGMGRRPHSAGARPSSAGGGRPSSAAGNRPSTANGRLSSSDSRPSSASGERPYSAGGRPSSANGRPSSAGRQPITVDEKGRPRYRTQRERVAERLEMRREHKEEKARLKAQKPKLEHLDWKMRGRALWMMFSMSYYTKVVLAIGILMLFIAIILIAVGASTEEDLKDADTITALLFVFGVLFIVISILAIRSRRREKAKRKRLGYDKKTGRYGPDIPRENGTNGTIPTISEEVDDEPRGHINGIPLEDTTSFRSEPKPKKPTFSAVKADEETGFTNLAVVMDADQLPGTPYRQRRRESIEESLTTFNRNHILASSSLKDDPDILVVPPPRNQLTTNNKSGNGKKVKKSKSPARTPNKSSLGDIPELVTTAPSPRPSPNPNRKAPPITIIDTDELDEGPVSKTTKKKYNYSNDGFDDGDITPNDLV